MTMDEIIEEAGEAIPDKLAGHEKALAREWVAIWSTDQSEYMVVGCDYRAGLDEHVNSVALEGSGYTLKDIRHNGESMEFALRVVLTIVQK